MYEKIDSNILNKIKITEQAENKESVIIYSIDFNATKEMLHSKYPSIIELPIISGFSTSLNLSEIKSIANHYSVQFITNDTKVCGLVYNSSKILHLESLKNKIKNRYKAHSCVVIDTGVYPHIDFCLGKNRIIKFIDLVNDKENMYDDNGHGTFVTGVLGGNSITSNLSGMDSSSDIIVIKALDKDGETTSIKILQAMQWVLDNKDLYNIKVVCMSFGSVVKDRADPLMFGVETLWNNGVVVVCAGGNSGPENSTIMSPGASSKVITVGALEIKNGKFEVADFSSRGPILNKYKPDMIVPGVDIISTNVFENNGKFYTELSGTSVSTPMVAGIVSLMYKIKDTYTPNEIKYMLINACTKINGDRNSEGYGVLDLRKLNII